MKRLIFTLLIALLAVPAFSGDLFLANFQNYRHAVRQALGLDTASTAIDDTTLNQFIREAVYHVNPIVKFRQKEFTFGTSYKNGKYALDTLISGIISVEWFNLDSVKTLVYVPRYSWYQLPSKQAANEPEAYARRPSYYDFTDSLIFLYPIPINPQSGRVADSIRILAWTKLPDFVNKDTLELVPQQYREAVEANAIYRAARSRQHPFTELFRNDYIQSLNNLKTTYGRPSAVPTPSSP